MQKDQSNICFAQATHNLKQFQSTGCTDNPNAKNFNDYGNTVYQQKRVVSHNIPKRVMYEFDNTYVQTIVQTQYSQSQFGRINRQNIRTSKARDQNQSISYYNQDSEPALIGEGQLKFEGG